MTISKDEFEKISLDERKMIVAKALEILSAHVEEAPDGLNYGYKPDHTTLDENVVEEAKARLGRFDHEMTLLGLLAELSKCNASPESLSIFSLKMNASRGRKPRLPTKNTRSATELHCCIRLMEKVMFCASQTYEGNPITIGISVFTDPSEVLERVCDYAEAQVNWIAKFDAPINSNELSNRQFFEISQISDGKSIFLVCDTHEKIYGYAMASEDVYKDSAVGEFDIVTTLSGGCILKGGTAFSSNYIHDGFSWNFSWNHSIIHQIHNFFRHRRARELSDSGPVASLPGAITDDRWISLAASVRQHSSIGRSSMICIATRCSIKNLVEQGLVSSLRPNMEAADVTKAWESKVFLAKILSLDGVHLFDTDLNLLHVCFRVTVPAVSTGKLSGSGSGSNAALFLSEQIGNTGIVLKVSSDGPIKLYKNGKQIFNQSELVNALPPFEPEEAISDRTVFSMFAGIVEKGSA